MTGWPLFQTLSSVISEERSFWVVRRFCNYLFEKDLLVILVVIGSRLLVAGLLSVRGYDSSELLLFSVIN